MVRAVPRALVLTLLLSFPPSSVRAADPPGEVPLGTLATSESFNELRQSLAPLPEGSSAVVWESRGLGNGDVHLQIVGPDGEKILGPHGALVAGTGLYESDAVVAASPEGTVFVAWKESVGRESLIRVQAYDRTGQVLWAAGGVFAANFPGPEYQDTPNLVPGPDGGIYVCLQGIGSTDDVKIRCNLLDAGGHPLWSEAGHEAGGLPGWRILPKAVSDGAGGLLVFWRNGRGIDDDQADLDLLEGQRFAPDGTPLWGPQGKVVRTTNQPERSGAGYTGLLVVPDGRGGAVLAFTDSSGNPDWGLDVYAQRVNASGETLWGSRAVVRSGKVDKQLSALIAAPDGGAFVVVSDFLGGSSVRSRVFRLSPQGRQLWTRKGVLLSNDKFQDYGAYGSFDGGVLRIAWIHQTEPGFFFDVNLAAFDLTGKRLTPAKGIPITRARDGQFLRGFVFDPERGQGFAVWNDRRKGSADLMDTYGGFYTEGEAP
jgi:hypothetical protein